MTHLLKFISLSLLLCSGMLVSCGPAGVVAQSAQPPAAEDQLSTQFVNPPRSAQARTWYHVMSGNMSKAGITKDLESMARVGIGGLLLFNVTQGIPLGDVIYDSPEHHDLLTHAAAESERLGLSFGVHNCDGWSSSGGPWVSPEQSMKMVVYRDTILRGGRNVDLQLPQPTVREGFYRDIATIAYPALGAEVDDQRNSPTLAASDARLNLDIVTDGRIDAQSTASSRGEDHPWVQFSYDRLKTIRSASAVFTDRHATAELQVSEDGKLFTSVRELQKVRTGKGEWAVNDHFPPVTARYFRLQFNRTVTLREVELTANYYYDNPLGRLAIARTEDDDLKAIGTPEADMVVDPGGILDLSDRVDESGRLVAALPAGDWTVIRFGYTSTGAFNNPASEEGRGLEVDKLSRAAFKTHYDNFVAEVIDNAHPVAPNALQYVEIDSYEMGGQNWTEGLDARFRERFGYDLLDFLPLLAGRFVGDADTAERVLEDYRRLISDLMTENYFGYFAELCRADGLRSYIEPYGFGPLNDLAVGGKADIPMGEFWMNRPITMAKSAVSAARIYGKPVISAESFTSRPEINWKGHPGMAKTSGDRGWLAGFNEFMFHRFVHQSNTEVRPGLTMNRWGFHFDRTQTWWENAGADWFRYIARGSYLLRQGVPVSDLLVFVGDGAPISTVNRDAFSPALPVHLNYDCTNAEVLTERLATRDKRLVLPEGTSYRMLALHNSDALTLSTLERLLEIARAGVPVYGEPPRRLIGYGHGKETTDRFLRAATALGGLLRPLSAMTVATPDAAFHDRADVSYVHRRTDRGEDIYFLLNPDSTATVLTAAFRQTDKQPERWNPMSGETERIGSFAQDGPTTVVDLPLEAGESVFVVFREPVRTEVTVQPGTRDPALGLARYVTREDGSTYVRVASSGSYRHVLSGGEPHETRVAVPDPIRLEGPWELQFREEDGYGQTVRMEALTDWKDHEDEQIRYYSGTATYRRRVTVPPTAMGADLRVLLDLGEVRTIAEVTVNGEPAGISWMPPHALDVTDLVRAGDNELRIAVTNLWSNRLIGDERYPANDGGYALDGHRPTTRMPEWFRNNEPRPAGERTTFTTGQFYRADDPLEPSGLLGPVHLRFAREVELPATR